MKGSFGFVAMILGILGIAKGAIISPQSNVGQIVGTNAGAGSIATLVAVVLLVGGILILAKSSRATFGGPRGSAQVDLSGGRPPLSAGPGVANES
jgi:hypothetical protein